MWYTVNASGDEFVRMRIRCHEHPVRACDALTCTSPGGFSVPTRELQTLNSVPEYIFKHLLYGFRLVILLISYLYFFRKTYICYVLTATYVAMIKKKSFVCGYTPKIFCHWHFRRLFSVVWKFFISSRHDKLHNKKPHCVFLITVRFFDFHQVFQIKNPHQRLQKCLGTARFIKNLMKNCVLEKTYAFSKTSCKMRGIVLQ